MLTYLASLNRTTADGTSSGIRPAASSSRRRCSPALFSVLTLFLLGGDIDTLRTDAARPCSSSSSTPSCRRCPTRPTLGPEEIDEATAVALALLPAAPAISTMGSLLFNMWLAGRITLASGRLQRPWPDLAAIVYPPATPLLLAVATGAGFLAGMPGLIASGFAGPLFLAYVLLGLAVVHYVTRGRSWRPFALWASTSRSSS